MIEARAFAGYVAITLDDGKVNALSFEVLNTLLDAFAKARHNAQGVLLIGRTGCFSAGYNLKVMQAGGEGRRQLRQAGDALKIAMLEHPYPVVIACTGHALAKGALLLLCADLRLGCEGEFKIGLNETAIGIALPPSAIELAKARLNRALHTQVMLNAALLNPTQARDAGFFDELIPRDGFLSAAHKKIQALLALDRDAYAQTKALLRAPLIDALKMHL